MRLSTAGLFTVGCPDRLCRPLRRAPRCRPPISLTVTSEIVKTVHAHFINCDLEMCHTDPLTGRCTPAQARTSGWPGPGGCCCALLSRLSSALRMMKRVPLY